MKTEELIKGLAADAATTPMPMGRAWWAALGGAVLLAAGTFFFLLGPRPDFMPALETWRFVIKFIITVLLAATALRATQVLTTPGGASRRALIWLLVAPVLLIAAVFIEMAVVPRDLMMPRMMGVNNMLCLLAIPAIGLLPLGVFLAVARHGAPTAPGVTGAVCGVLAGGLAATFYAAHCTDDSPLFVVVWYTLAIAIMAFIGAIAGRRVLRW